MTRPDRNPVPPMKEFPVPINRKGLPVQPLWLLSVLSVLSAAALTCGLAWGDGCRHGPCHRRAGGRGNGMPDPALLPVPGTAHDALDADPAAAYQHGRQEVAYFNKGIRNHRVYRCGNPIHR